MNNYNTYINGNELNKNKVIQKGIYNLFNFIDLHQLFILTAADTAKGFKSHSQVGCYVF